jgi:KipI family sensor histidine kinase inhibitor
LQSLLLRNSLPGQVDVIAGAGSVTVLAESASAARRIRDWLDAADFDLASTQTSRLVTIDTIYDGDDLGVVEELTGLSRDSVVSAHTGQTWVMVFAGFAPGFAYLEGEDSRLSVPRRAEPRTSVPAGSVALASDYSAVYPRESPGGWQLIGRTRTEMWDLDRREPALVNPGDRVRFRAVRDSIHVKSSRPKAHDAPRHPSSGLRVIAPGVLSLVQDLGRPGFAKWGVSASGAADVASFRRANRLVGNQSQAACIEVAGGQLQVQAIGDQVVAVAGAPADLTVDSDSVRPSWAPAMAAPFALRDGETLTMGELQGGTYTYLAVRGGVAGDSVLGSRSTDTLSGLGGQPLIAGIECAVSEDTETSVVGPPELQPEFPSTGPTDLEVVVAPGLDWFDDEGLARLLGQDWLVTPQTNRVGAKLRGEPITRVRAGEFPSEGMIRGAVQVPPAGMPVLFLADHPVTGGYPVIAAIVETDLDRAAQVPVGGVIRFRLAPR